MNHGPTERRGEENGFCYFCPEAELRSKTKGERKQKDTARSPDQLTQLLTFLTACEVVQTKLRKGKPPPHQRAEQSSSQGRRLQAAGEEAAVRVGVGCRLQGRKLLSGWGWGDRGVWDCRLEGRASGWRGGGCRLEGRAATPGSWEEAERALTSCQSPEAAGHRHCILAPVGPRRGHSPKGDEDLFPSQGKEAGIAHIYMTEAVLLKAHLSLSLSPHHTL